MDANKETKMIVLFVFVQKRQGSGPSQCAEWDLQVQAAKRGLEEAMQPASIRLLAGAISINQAGLDHLRTVDPQLEQSRIVGICRGPCVACSPERRAGKRREANDDIV